MKHEINLCKGNSQKVFNLIWSTDLHLDAVEEKDYDAFIEALAAAEGDKILITGDISNGIVSLGFLKDIHQKTEKEIYFVLGNHDFYYNNIYDVKELAAALTGGSEGLYYLSSSSEVPLGAHVAMIGHDGWADGRAGDFLGSDVSLNDYVYIEDLKNLDKLPLLKKLMELGDDAAEQIATKLKELDDAFNTIIVLTHAPPFPQACRYHDHECDDNWGPHFVCVAMGNVLRRFALENPHKEVLVLCGHAHSYADVHILPNLRVLTGHVDLGFPSIQGTIQYFKE